MRLHDDIALFRDAVTATAQQMNLPEVYVEKDYWVTYALKPFSPPMLGSFLYSKEVQPCLNATSHRAFF